MDNSARLLVAYGLIAMLVLLALAGIAWRRLNSPSRQDARERVRREKIYRRRPVPVEAADAGKATD